MRVSCGNPPDIFNPPVFCRFVEQVIMKGTHTTQSAEKMTNDSDRASKNLITQNYLIQIDEKAHEVYHEDKRKDISRQFGDHSDVSVLEAVTPAREEPRSSLASCNTKMPRSSGHTYIPPGGKSDTSTVTVMICSKVTRFQQIIPKRKFLYLIIFPQRQVIQNELSIFNDSIRLHFVVCQFNSRRG